jgi:hypothetical protein
LEAQKISKNRRKFSPDVTTGGKVEDVRHEKGEGEEENVEEDVDDGPREDAAAEVAAAATGAAKATTAAHSGQSS